MPNPARYWLLAARPKTLPAALIPVVCATALAFAHGAFKAMPALLCCAFAVIMQIAANYINDLIDYQRGSDGSDRLGPKRACAQGWISPRAMKRGIILTLVLACSVGLCLLRFGGLGLILLGAACVVFAFLYTTLLSYIGCGDLLVWGFFGFVPVCGTYYVQANCLPAPVWWLAAACGLVVDTLLVLNNYRDREEDARNNKRTLIVVLGERFGSLFYLLQGLAGCAIAAALILLQAHHAWAALLLIFYLTAHVRAWRGMMRIHKGQDLNKILGSTSVTMLLFALTFSLALVITAF